MDSREIALLALVSWEKKGTFIWDFLQKWKIAENPKACDLNFAYELACGTMRLQRYLDAHARALCAKLPTKSLERNLLRLALYQRIFCQNIPLYAVVNTSVELAKQYTHGPFASFLNATLRKEIPQLPLQLAERYSYSDYFVQELTAQYGEEKAIEILERGNLPSNRNLVAYGVDAYIQNITQVLLMQKQAALLGFKPKTILDLCASPGGKTLLLHKLFPEAELISNDVSAAKTTLLNETLQRFHCPATITTQDGTNYTSEKLFDLILVDAPCSNSGVLYKCPEARWRLEAPLVDNACSLQLALLKRASQLLSPHGKIWYHTCSILQQENEKLIARSGLTCCSEPLLQLPSSDGHEGGFASTLIAGSEGRSASSAGTLQSFE